MIINKIKDFGDIESEVLKELEKWHLKVYDISDETIEHEGWYIDKNQAKEVIEMNDWDREFNEITLKKEPEPNNEKAIKLTQEKIENCLDNLEMFLCADFGQKDWSVKFLHKHFELMRKSAGIRKYDFERHMKNIRSEK